MMRRRRVRLRGLQLQAWSHALLCWKKAWGGSLISHAVREQPEILLLASLTKPCGPIRLYSHITNGDFDMSEQRKLALDSLAADLLQAVADQIAGRPFTSERFALVASRIDILIECALLDEARSRLGKGADDGS